MKQLLPLFLFLVPCLAWAQYPSNGNQKITLGEQTSADGLIYRGVAATDTVRKPSIDTMAYMVLDTTTNIMWHYKKATSNAWLRLNLLPSDTASMLTNYWRAGRFSGVLPVANGGTNASTFTEGSVVFAGASGTYTQDNSGLFFNNTNDRLGIGTTSPTEKLSINGNFNTTSNSNYFLFGTNTTVNPYFTGTSTDQFIFGTRNLARLTVQNNGDILIASLVGAGSRAVNAAADGTLSAASSILIKENVENINYGLSDVLKLKPVIFNYIDRNKWGEGKDLGFVAEDVMNVIPEATGVMNNSDIYFDLQKLVPVLTKAIQEQQALIKALEQRIINLENK